MVSKFKSYQDRTDLEKIESNWKKLSGLYRRGEWSSAIVRAATAAEIATNLVVREELENQKGIDKPFVDHLMIWANGIQGKYQKLILPAVSGKDYEQRFKDLSGDIGGINTARNAIVHAGYFTDSAPAHETIVKSRGIILAFVKQYHPSFDLIEIKLIEESSSKPID